MYKDVIEPLESVSVSITKTDKDVISDFGTPAEVRPQPGSPAVRLAGRALTTRRLHAHAGLHGSDVTCPVWCLSMQLPCRWR